MIYGDGEIVGKGGFPPLGVCMIYTVCTKLCFVYFLILDRYRFSTSTSTESISIIIHNAFLFPTSSQGKKKIERLPWLGAFALRLWEGIGAVSRFFAGWKGRET